MCRIQAHWQAISFQLSTCLDGNSSHMLFKVVCLHVRSRVQMQLFLVLTVHSEGCLGAPWQAVSPPPAQPNAFFWYNTSGSYPDSFLQRHGWGWGLICLDEEPFPPEDLSVSEVTLVDKVYCWVHGLREWLSVIHFTVVFIWLVDATVFLPYVIRPIRYILHLLSSWCAPHHANRDVASEPDPGAILLGGGWHRLSLVSHHHPATGGVSLPHQTCLQVSLPPAQSLKFKQIFCTLHFISPWCW